MPMFMLLLAACAVRLEGLVDKRPLGTWIETPLGREYQLVLGEESAPVAYLDGLLVDVEGRRAFRRVTVTDWEVREGTHGLSTWVGILEKRGVQLGLADRNSGSWYFLEPESAEPLMPMVGRPVLVEGYVEGAHQVTVMYYRPLFDDGGDRRE